jgi:acyl dehydratase
MPRSISGLDDLRSCIGSELGETPWRNISQDRINKFAEATDDPQWIHIDVERAKTESPFGTTIAHGYLTLSLIPSFLEELVTFDGFSFAVNYGLNKLRFPHPVPSGSNVRARASVTAVEDVPGGAQATIAVTVEVEGVEKPALATEVLFRLFA